MIHAARRKGWSEALNLQLLWRIFVMISKAVVLFKTEWMKLETKKKIQEMLIEVFFCPSLSPGRASLHGKASLQIDPVRSEDQGWYECRVLMLEKQYKTFHNGSWVHLTVNGESPALSLCLSLTRQHKCSRCEEGEKKENVIHSTFGKPNQLSEKSSQFVFCAGLKILSFVF